MLPKPLKGAPPLRDVSRVLRREPLQLEGLFEGLSNIAGVWRRILSWVVLGGDFSGLTDFLELLPMADPM